MHLYSVSQKIPPPWGLVAIFPKPLGIFQPNFTCLLCVPMYARVRIFTQLPATWQSYAILSVTTQCTYVHKMSTISQNAFSDIFPKQLWIFSLNFTRLLNIRIYARMQIFVQLSLTVMKLCHIKCDHAPSVRFGRWWTFTLWWSPLIWHNFVKVADNWVKICSSA